MPVTIGGSGPITGVTSINTTVSDTELGYLDGVTSALQTQINAKANDSSQGLYLITPTSIANSGGSASASGGTVTFSGVTTFSLNGVFSGTYENYLAVLFYVPTGDNNADIRLRVSGSDATGANYNFREMTAAAGGVGTTRITGQTTFRAGYQGTLGTAHQITFYRPFTAASTLMQVHNFYERSAATEYTIQSGIHTLANSYDGFTFIGSAGSITGTVRVYGYKN